MGSGTLLNLGGTSKKNHPVGALKCLIGSIKVEKKGGKKSIRVYFEKTGAT